MKQWGKLEVQSPNKKRGIPQRGYKMAGKFKGYKPKGLYPVGSTTLHRGSEHKSRRQKNGSIRQHGLPSPLVDTPGDIPNWEKIATRKVKPK